MESRGTRDCCHLCGAEHLIIQMVYIGGDEDGNDLYECRECQATPPDPDDH